MALETCRRELDPERRRFSMGTTGSGKFEDYETGAEDEDRCDKAFTAELEEVATCAFFNSHEDLPLAEAPVRVQAGQRLVVLSSETEEEIGYLPTEFNYLRGCINLGRIYEGAVRSSGKRPLPRVSVDIAPTS